jgi:MoaA/NifB/PqqE/SkfB family radical SAM enzyme
LAPPGQFPPQTWYHTQAEPRIRPFGPGGRNKLERDRLARREREVTLHIRTVLGGFIRTLPLPARRRLNRFRKEHLRPLADQLPLSMPETVHIDPTNACNFKCTFCPTADPALLASVGRPKGLMDFELFCKIIDDLQAMVRAANRKLTLLHLYKDGEPLLHKRFPEMVTYAKRAQVAKVVGTTTNGSTLTEELCGRLVACGLDHVRISVVGLDDQSYRDLTVTFGDYEKIRQNVARLYQEKKRRKSRLRVLVKTNDTGMTPEQRHRFERDFKDISDMVQIDTLMGWSLSEAKDFMLGRVVSTGMDSISPLRTRQVCPEPFSRLAVNFDGRVSVCCVDWSFGTIVGDLRVESLADVWNGERLREFRLAHLRGRRDTIPACAQCQYVQGAALSRDLDDHAARLLPVYESAGTDRGPLAP